MLTALFACYVSVLADVKVRRASHTRSASGLGVDSTGNHVGIVHRSLELTCH